MYAIDPEPDLSPNASKIQDKKDYFMTGHDKYAVASQFQRPAL
jgi:hypothetical protein